MPSRHAAPFRLPLARLLLLVAMPLACAKGVDPDDSYEGDDVSTAGSGGSGGSGSVVPTGGAGTDAGGKPSSAGSGSSSLGGTSATSGGKPSGGSTSGGAGSGGSAGGGAGGTGTGGKGGTGGAGGTGGGASGSGGGGNSCMCGTPLMWKDDTNISWKTGDCFLVGTATYVYVGMKMQTYANGSCNPMKQLSWCTNSDTDYKFMLCK